MVCGATDRGGDESSNGPAAAADVLVAADHAEIVDEVEICGTPHPLVDLDAETPAEIAISVLGEVVSERESLGRGHPVEAEVGIDPAALAGSLEHEGETSYFCCEGCADAVVEQPGEHLGTA